MSAAENRTEAPPLAVVAEARKWIGTPYQHQAACRGVGADCLGLIRGVFAAFHPADKPTVPAYRRWVQPGEPEHLWQAAQSHLLEKPMPHPARATPFSGGEIVLFRLRPTLPARHLAILTSPSRMVHALTNSGVCEVDFTPWWQRHSVARFAIPKNETAP